jgi:hypothetical protein
LSYSTIAICVADAAFIARIQSAIAQEQRSRDESVNPSALLEQMRWTVASASDVEAAYASALAANNPAPGSDETVVTDGMILANVQASWPSTP